MPVRAKFYVESITEYANNGGRTIKLRPVYSNDPNHENKAFWDATPSGSIELGVKNSEAASQFVVGAEYYIDFQKVDGSAIDYTVHTAIVEAL